MRARRVDTAPARLTKPLWTRARCSKAELTYSFSKVLTPGVAGDPTDGQQELTQKLAYVCFSRAEVNLRILMLSRDAEATKKELIERGLFQDGQVSIL